MAMGQRGTYLAMLAHAGMLDKSDSHFDMEECRREPERAWEEWKDLESRHRYAYLGCDCNREKLTTIQTRSCVDHCGSGDQLVL